jgi:hypothetical protein
MAALSPPLDLRHSNHSSPKKPETMPERHWKQLYHYWLSKHVDDKVPSRADIDPVIDIPQLVKNLILLDAKNEFTYRLIGSEAVERHGMDMTGRKSGSSGKAPKAISEWKAALDYVARELRPAPARLTHRRRRDCQEYDAAIAAGRPRRTDRHGAGRLVL